MLSPEMQLMLYKQREKELMKEIEQQRIIQLLSRQRRVGDPWHSRFAKQLSSAFRRVTGRPAIEARPIDPCDSPEAADLFYPCLENV